MEELRVVLRRNLELNKENLEIYKKLYKKLYDEFILINGININKYNIHRGLNPYFIIRALLEYKELPLITDRWEQSNDSILTSNSANCKFTIGTDGINNYFIKVISILGDNGNLTSDLIIFDILNSIIFKNIRDKGIIFRDKIDKYIPKFIDANYSYITTIMKDKNEKWDYKLLMDKENSKSPLNLSIRNIKERIRLYNNDRYVYITDAISDNKSITEILETIFNIILLKPLKVDIENDDREYEMNGEGSEKIRMKMGEIKENYKIFGEIIKNMVDLYDFIENMSYYFNFLHNDLHLGNILCKIRGEIGELKLIDLGRVSFGFFTINKSKDIEDELLYYMDKLEISKIYLGKKTEEFICENMIDRIYNENFYYPQGRNVRRLFIENISKYTKDNNLYICLDLTTLTLNLFIYFSIYSIFIGDKDNEYISDDIIRVIEFIEICKDIVELGYTSSNLTRDNISRLEILDKYYNINIRSYLRFKTIELDEIFNKYREIREKIEGSDKIAELFRRILDGILFMNLMIKNEILEDTEGIIEDKGTYKLLLNNNKIIYLYCQFYERGITSRMEEKLEKIKRLFNKLNEINKNYLRTTMNKSKLFKSFINGMDTRGGNKKLKVYKNGGKFDKSKKTKITRGEYTFKLDEYLREIERMEGDVKSSIKDKMIKKDSKSKGNNINEIHEMYKRIYEIKEESDNIRKTYNLE